MGGVSIGPRADGCDDRKDMQVLPAGLFTCDD
jgi:hypothetical protein